MGRGVESSRLYADKRRNVANVETLERFLSGLSDAGLIPALSEDGRAVIWKCVPAGAVADMLESFLSHPLKFEFQGDAIAEFLRRRSMAADGLVSEWTVAVPIEGLDHRLVDELPSLSAWTVKPGYRKMKFSEQEGSLQVSGNGAKVGGRADLRHGLSAEAYAALRASKNEDDFRQQLKSPLLIIYLLRGFLQADAKAPKVDYRDGLLLPALGLHFPMGPEPDEPGQLIRYRINSVAQKQLFPDQEEDDDDIADESDDID
jgi:hypothetical protein